jgi:hypothetical protein
MFLLFGHRNSIFDMSLGLHTWTDEDRAMSIRLQVSHLVGENICRCPTSRKILECQASKFVNSDACPRPATQDYISEFGARGSVAGGQGRHCHSTRSLAVIDCHS